MKRLFVLLLSGIVLSSSVTSSAFAAINKPTTATAPQVIKAEDTSSSSASDPTNKGLEAAILAVKAKITIPKEYSQFNYYFYNTTSYADSYWSLTWSVPDTGAFIQVNCDQDNHIVSYNKNDYKKNTSSIAKSLKSELKATADAFIQKIAPEVSTKLEYLETSYEGIYSNNYVYSYQRTNNGIAFPDNTVTVSVNSITGEVSAANISWLYDVTVPSSSVKITKEKAIKLLKEKLKMKLVYRTEYIGIYDKGIYTTSKKAFLVYEPSESYISVDAKTGEVYLTRSQWIDTAIEEGVSKEAADATGAVNGTAQQVLTEEEIAKIQELKGLISKDKAIKVITSNTSLYLDKNLKSYTATLNKSQDSKGDSNYVWNINLNDPREITTTDTYRAYAYATVDAKSGKILSFYSSVKSYYDEKTQTWKSVKIKYSMEKGKAILENFLKAQNKDHFNKSILASTNDDYVAYYKEKTPIYGGYSYQYNRVNEGVEYPYNGIYGCVDGITGKIYSYSSNWDDNVVFESPKGAITADKAMDYYLSKDGFDLKYEINVINQYDSSYMKDANYFDNSNAYSIKYEIRLVYRPDVNPTWISPFTGDQLGNDGKVYTETKPYAYQDVINNDANRNILLLADMGIGFEGTSFLPEKAITIGELNEILNKIGYGYLTEDQTNKDQPITKEEIAYTFIQKLGLEKMSNLSGIYRTGYVDEADINSKYYGAVALAKGLGLVSGDANNYFKPKSQVTRFEAVNLIMNFINVSNEGMYQ